MVVARPSPRMVKASIAHDKGYDYDDIRLSAKRRDYITPRPLSWSGPASQETWAESSPLGDRAFTNRWHNLFRRLKIRFEVNASNYLAFVDLASAIICFRRARD